MDVLAILGSAAIVGSLFVAWWAVSGASSGQVDLGPTEAQPADLRSRYLDQAASTRVASPIFERFGGLVRRWSPAGRVRELETKLARAGYPAGWTVERVLAFKVLLSLLLAASVWLLVGEMTLVGVLLVIASGAIGFFVPDTMLDHRADNRKLAVRVDLSDVIDQMSMMVRAGLGIDAAISRTARSSTGPLAEEFTRVGHDIRMGVDRSVALANLANRVDVPELNSLVAALNQAERLGVPISQTLEIQAGELRLKRRQLAEEQAMKLPVKILFPLVFCILPVMMIVVLGPAAISIFESF